MTTVLIILLVLAIGFFMWGLCRAVSIYDEYEERQEWERYERYINSHREEVDDAEEEKQGRADQ